eukprot:1324069-Amorphochlora_amoeboformis.AAC.1
MVKSKGLQRMMNTLWWSFSALSNILLILLLVTFIFAVAGVSLFGEGKNSNKVTLFLSFYGWKGDGTGQVALNIPSIPNVGAYVWVYVSVRYGTFLNERSNFENF